MMFARSLVTSVATLFLLTVDAVADEATDVGKAMFDRMDSDGDGRLSKAEFPAALSRLFGRIDKDGDGFVSFEEHGELRRRLRPSSLKLPSGARAYRNLRYVHGGHERHRLDLYLPPAGSEPSPLVIWIHGGAWRKGDKGNCPALPLVREGFAVASINYRLSSHAVFPAQIKDCKAAVRWLRANARMYHLHPDRFGAWGSSAGGHLVALLGTSGDVEELEGDLGNDEQSSRVQAVVDYFGPTDLLQMNSMAGDAGKLDHDAPDSPESQLLGGPLQQNPEAARRANPITYVSGDDPPFLIVHGDQDGLVNVGQSRILHKALVGADVNSKLHVVPNAGHGRFRQPAVEQLVWDFFKRTLKPESAESQERDSAETQ